MSTVISDSEVEQDYKEIFIRLDSDLNLRDDSFLHNLFNKFPEYEITYDLSDKDFTLFLNAVDIEFLSNQIELIKKDSVSKTLIELLDAILENIDSIKSYGLKNNKRVYVGYNQERKVKGRKAKEQNRNKYYYASDNGFLTTNNSVPKEYEDVIICGDSLEVLKHLPDNCIDLVFSSPPYNFGLEYESNEDAQHWDNYFNKLFGIFDECIRVLKYGGRIAINIQPLFSDYIPSHHVVSNYFMSRKLIWKGEILWEKNNYNCKYTAWGTHKNNHYGIHIHAN